MSTEEISEQNVHDRAIKDIASNPELYPSWGQVITNPGSEKNKAIKGQYPDIIFLVPRTGMELNIGEVETESSVNENVAINKWREYGKLYIPFNLFVPDSCLEEATDLVKEHNVKASIHAYRYSSDSIEIEIEID